MYKYRKVYKACQGKDKACLKVDQEVSFGREGGREETQECDAADVGDNQREQAQEPPTCPLRYPNVTALNQYFHQLGSAWPFGPLEPSVRRDLYTNGASV